MVIRWLLALAMLVIGSAMTGYGAYARRARARLRSAGRLAAPAQNW